MAFGIWAFGQIADRIGRKPIFILFQIGAAIMVYLYSRVTEPHMLLWIGAVMGMFVNGMLGGIGALVSEVYPTTARATAQNVLFNIGRAVGSPGPLAVGALAAKYSFNAANRPARVDLPPGYHRYSVLDSGAQGQGARVNNPAGSSKDVRCTHSK